MKKYTFYSIFLSKIPFKLSRHFENQWAVFGTSQPGQKRHLTMMSSMVAPSISLILTGFTCSPIASFLVIFVQKNYQLWNIFAQYEKMHINIAKIHSMPTELPFTDKYTVIV